MAPITLYTWGTPNGFKASVTLEELGVEYKTHPINIAQNVQKEDWFLKINPNGRIPAIVDHSNGDFAVFESGALMIYLADKYGDGSLLPKEGNQRYQILSWLMFQMGGLGPMQGQTNHFVHYAPEKVPYGQKRYWNETRRLVGVLEDGLKDKEYLVGNRFSLADIANFCWTILLYYVGIDVDDFPNVKAWISRIAERPKTLAGLDVPEPSKMKEFLLDDAARKAKAQEIRATLTVLDE